MASDRRTLLKASLLGLGSLTITNAFGGLKSFQTTKMEKDKLDPVMVQEFVGNCHGNIDKVKELYTREPRLVFASHDWGGGDFENGIEAAGHVGHKGIVQFLLEKGARINFFTLCMLGEYQLVKHLLKAHPSLLHAKGPHGFSALHHAVQGGAEAKKVKELLEKLGATQKQYAL